MGIKFIVSLVLMYLYVYLKTKKSFHMLQQNWYNDGNRYVKWIIKNKKQEFFNIFSSLNRIFTTSGGRNEKRQYCTIIKIL